MASEAAAERARVEARIPHRPPFLLVDRIVEEGAGRIHTAWRVPPELECFRGHYPGDPVLPGVLLTEHCLQSGALLVLADGAPAPGPGALPVVTRIEDARFRRLVRPGDLLESEVTLDESLGPARYCSAKVRRGGEAVARLRFVLALTAGEQA